MAAEMGCGMDRTDRGEALAVAGMPSVHFTAQNWGGGGAVVKTLVLGTAWNVVFYAVQGVSADQICYPHAVQ